MLPLSLHIRPIANAHYPLSNFTGGGKRFPKGKPSPNQRRTKSAMTPPRHKRGYSRGKAKSRYLDDEDDDEGARWVVSLSVNEAQRRGFVYMRRIQIDDYTVSEERTLWLHSVVTTDGPNTTVYLTHVEQCDSPGRSRAPAISGGSDWELVPSPQVPVVPKPDEKTITMKRTFHIKLSLAAIGISFVDHRPREVRESRNG